MIDRTHQLSLTKQAKALGICRGSVDYMPRTISSTDLGLIHRVDELRVMVEAGGSAFELKQRHMSVS